MKKAKTNIITLSCIVVSVLASCAPSPTKEYIVEYYFNNTVLYKDSVREYSTARNYQAPNQETEKFLYWIDSNGEKFNFMTPILSDTKLVAYYEFDKKITEDTIRNTYMSSHILVSNKTIYQYSFLFYKDELEVEGHGSGVIIYKEDDYYYALTNSHVILVNEYISSQATSLDFYKIEVLDNLDNNYDAEVLAYDINYDLALIKFSCERDLYVTPIAEKNPIASDICIAIGNPYNKRNIITFGNVIDYTKINLFNSKNISDVKFDVIHSDAKIKPGNSGGALLNDRLELIGINYAKNMLTTNNAYSIPCNNVKEFIREHTDLYWNIMLYKYK